MHQLHSMAIQEQQKIDAVYEALAQAQALQRTRHFTQGLQQLDQVVAPLRSRQLWRATWPIYVLRRADAQKRLGGMDDTAGEIATSPRVISVWEAALAPEHENLGVVHHNLGTSLRV